MRYAEYPRFQYDQSNCRSLRRNLSPDRQIPYSYVRVIRSAPPEDDDDLIDEVAAFPPFTASAATSRDPRAYLLQPRCFPSPFRNKNTHPKWVCMYVDYNDRWGGRRLFSGLMLCEQFLYVITTSTSDTHSRSSALESLATPIRCGCLSISCGNALLLVKTGCQRHVDHELLHVSAVEGVVFDAPKSNIDELLRVTQSPPDVGTYYSAQYKHLELYRSYWTSCEPINTHLIGQITRVQT